ncbi:protelomerase family protein [Leptolyngbya ohadii]|uniref:protelomerase family protein n=1 Tax=Leptolyngbya ohadii TaxID=1962290 RepID=UPI000B59BBA0|nr:protelomerase family protein [Leptolyngbya ohadii]
MDRTQIIQDYLQRIYRNDRIKLTTDERSFLVQDFIQQLAQLEDPQEIEALCENEITMLEEGYGRGSNSTTNYLSKYRTAIAEAAEQGKLPMTENTSYLFRGQKQRTGEPIRTINHIAFDLMRYDNSVYLANRKATNVGNNERQDNPQPFNPNLYLEKATELLQSDEAEVLAIGIAAVTGRRHTEVAVSGQFSPAKHPYVLTFDGQLKKDQPVAYTIATLLPAQEVMEAIERFRAMPQVQAMEGLTSEDQLVKNFRARVNTRVKQHFQKTEILPILPGFQSVSVHRLRGAYARMIIYYWLPNQGANEQRFLQFYLGHVEANEMRDAPNSSSTTHYFGYRLVDDAGNPITASGIKLMANPPLPSPTQTQVEDQLKANEQLEVVENSSDSDSESDDQTLEDDQTMTPLHDMVEAIAQQLEVLPSKQPVETQPKNDRPKRQSKPKLKELSVNVDDLAAAAEKLGLELPKGKSYQTLLNQILQNLASADIEESEPVSSTSQATGFNELLAPLMQELSALRGQLQDTQGERESVRLLGQEVKQLGDRLSQVEQERDRLQAQVEQLMPLQTECDRLKGQLQAAQDHLNQFRLIALGATSIDLGSSPAAAAAPSPATTPAIAPAQPVAVPSPASPVPAPSPVSAKPDRKPASRKKLSPNDRIGFALEAIMLHNESCTDPKDRWFVSYQVIADMSGTNNFTKVKPWFEARPEVLEQVHQHNERMGTTNAHHNRGREKEGLKSIYETFVASKGKE